MPHAPDDELLSALIDGETVDGDAAHVADCPECQARLAELRSVVHAVATPVQLPAAHLRDTAVAHALEKPAAASPMRRMNTLSAAAALVLALAIGGLVLSQIDRGSNNNTTANNVNTLGALAPNADGATPTAGRNSKDAASDSDASGLASTEAATAGSSSGYDAGDVGRYREIDDVIARATADLSKSAEEKAEHSMQTVDAGCDVDQTILWRATLYYLDQPAIARVRVLSSSRWILEIRSRDASECALLASREFAPTTPR